MVQIVGKYKQERVENLEEYLRVVGMSDEFIEKATKPGSTLDVVVDGKHHSFTSSNGVNFSFVLDEEYPEPLLQGAKSFAKREGDTFTITSKLCDQTLGERVYEFTDKGLTAVYTMKNVTAKRHYTKI